MEQLILSHTTEEKLFQRFSDLLDTKLSQVNHPKKDTYVSRLDLAKGNWSGGFSMSAPTQDKLRAEGKLKAHFKGSRVYYLESELMKLK